MNPSLTASISSKLLAVLTAVVVTGCAATQPQSTVSRNLDSGVTSNNGGGMTPANFGTFAPQPVRP